MAAAKLASEQQKEQEDDEEEKDDAPIEEVKTQNIAKIEVEDEFDVNDIWVLKKECRLGWNTAF